MRLLSTKFIISLAFVVFALAGCKSVGDRDHTSDLEATNRSSAIVKVSAMITDDDPEMQALARSFKSNGSDVMIDYRKKAEVIVYRAIGNIPDIKQLNLNANYSKGLNHYGEDFVTHDLGWASHYGTYSKRPYQGVLIKYKIPANLLAPDKSMPKQEPYYVISRTKLVAAGVRNVSLFVESVARINTDMDDNINHRISDEQDPRLKWISAKDLQDIKSRSKNF